MGDRFGTCLFSRTWLARNPISEQLGSRYIIRRPAQALLFQQAQVPQPAEVSAGRQAVNVDNRTVGGIVDLADLPRNDQCSGVVIRQVTILEPPQPFPVVGA